MRPALHRKQGAPRNGRSNQSRGPGTFCWLLCSMLNGGVHGWAGDGIVGNFLLAPRVAFSRPPQDQQRNPTAGMKGNANMSRTNAPKKPYAGQERHPSPARRSFRSIAPVFLLRPSLRPWRSPAPQRPSRARSTDAHGPKTGIPLAGATVRLVPAGDTARVIVTGTSELGFFAFQGCGDRRVHARTGPQSASRRTGSRSKLAQGDWTA